MNLEKYLLLNKRKIILIPVLWIVSVILHNLFYALFEFEEAFFFFLAVIIIPFYALIAVIYSVLYLILRKTNLRKLKRINKRKNKR